ncbi:MAG: Rab family GTPase [Candidatus Heimdallarchaeota archaeon]
MSRGYPLGGIQITEKKIKTRLILKIVLCGPSLVGKTCFSTRFVDGYFDPEMKKTIGVDFSLKNMTITQEVGRIAAGKEITLQIWDFAGEDRFRNVLPMYVAGTRGLLLAFDLTRPETLRELPIWLNTVRPQIDESIPIVLVGMKSDLKAIVSEDEIQSFLKECDVNLFITVSSLNGDNVEDCFTLITEEVLKRHIGNDSQKAA